MADDEKVDIQISAQHLADLDKQLSPPTGPTTDPDAYHGHIDVVPGADTSEHATIHATPEAAAALHDALQKFVDSDASFAMVKHANVVPSPLQNEAPPTPTDEDAEG